MSKTARILLIYAVIGGLIYLAWYLYKYKGWFGGTTDRPNACAVCVGQRQAEGLTYPQAMDSCIGSGKCTGSNSGAFREDNVTVTPTVNYVITEDHARQIGLIK